MRQNPYGDEVSVETYKLVHSKDHGNDSKDHLNRDGNETCGQQLEHKTLSCVKQVPVHTVDHWNAQANHNQKRVENVNNKPHRQRGKLAIGKTNFFALSELSEFQIPI
jgi:hypothetical protein